MAFNACIRFAFNIKGRRGTSAHQNKILGCSIINYLELETCHTLHKIITTCAPKYLFDRLIRSRSARTFNLKPVKRKLSSYDGLFFITAINLWNNLPIELRKVRNSKKFREKCLIFIKSL